MTLEQVIMTRGERKHCRTRKTRVACVAAVMAVFLLGTCAMAANASMTPRIPMNTYVAGVDVSGLTRQEASERIAASLAWADRQITLRWAKDGVAFANTVSLDSLGLRADIDGTLKGVPTTLLWGKSTPRRDVPLCVTVDDDKLDEAVSRLRTLVDTRASDARLVITEDDKVQIIEGTAGKALNAARLKDLLGRGGRWSVIPSTVELPVEAVEPGTMADDLRAMGVSAMIASYSTAVNKDNNRTENIRLAAQKLDNYLLPPGREFSFNSVVGPRTAEDGYRETPVYWRDEVRTGIGGGICQLSTTLYNAVLLADLEVVERHSHSLTVDYVPLGRDAAVSYGEVDLKFRNNTPNHILIRAYVAGGKVYVKMFGHTGADRKVAINARVLKKTDFVTETIEDPTLAKGQVQVRNGKPGYVVRSERIVYVDGQQVKKEDLGISSYYTLKKQVKLGPGAVPPDQAQAPAVAQPPAQQPQAPQPPSQPATAQPQPQQAPAQISGTQPPGV
ncbi:MAG: VanW family protein [Ignavibacteriales bacterium]